MSLSYTAAPAGALPPPSGFRRMNLEMLAARERADQFSGAPKGTAKPLTYLMAFQEAEPYLGLPPHGFKLVSWLVKQTMAHDWEEGSRPIAWPSARRQQEFLGLSAARVKMLNRALFELGIFVLRDNEQGKRYGRRGPDKRIIEAYGFDLSPLAQRYDEFIRLAAEAKTERGRMKDLRARVTIARRAIRQAGEVLAEAGKVPAEWRRVSGDTADLVAVARGCVRSDHLGVVANSLETLKAEAERLVMAAFNAVKPDPEGPAHEPHSTSTNLSSESKDTVFATEESSEAVRTAPQPQTWSARTDQQEPIPSTVRIERLKLTVEELVRLVPRLGQYIRGNRPTWRDAVDAAGGPLCHELGVSQSLWAEACSLLGRDGATLALAIVATKGDGHFTSSPGGYFGGMVRRAAKGELFLEKSLWGLRTNNYGQPGVPAGTGRGRGH